MLCVLIGCSTWIFSCISSHPWISPSFISHPAISSSVLSCTWNYGQLCIYVIGCLFKCDMIKQNASDQDRKEDWGGKTDAEKTASESWTGLELKKNTRLRISRRRWGERAVNRSYWYYYSTFLLLRTTYIFFIQNGIPFRYDKYTNENKGCSKANILTLHYKHLFG